MNMRDVLTMCQDTFEHVDCNYICIHTLCNTMVLILFPKFKKLFEKN